MQLNKLEKNDKIHKSYRNFGLVAVVLALAISAFNIIYGSAKINAAVAEIKESVLVIDKNNNVYQTQAVRRSDEEVRKLQYELQLKLWTYYWWQYDVNSYEESINSGYAISGKCGDELYAQFEAKKVFEDMLSNNKHYKIYITKSYVDPTTYPPQGKIEATRITYSPVGEIRRSFKGTVTFLEGDISPENQLGIIIETFTLEEYDVLETISYDL